MIQSIIFSLGLIWGVPSEGKETLKANTTASTIAWVAKKVGGQHDGIVNLKEGSLEVTDNVITGGSFVIDMTSLECKDLTGEYKGKLEGHLKSDDFFAVASNPIASFVVTSAIPQGTGLYKIVGNLTIKGITKEIKFPATVTTEGNKTTANANITVDRSEFNVRYGSSSFFEGLGDKVIYDDFTLAVTLVASK